MKIQWLSEEFSALKAQVYVAEVHVSPAAESVKYLEPVFQTADFRTRSLDLPAFLDSCVVCICC